MAEVPQEALRDKALPPAARLILVALWRRATKDRRFVWPSRDTLASDVGMPARTMRRHLATLRQQKWILEVCNEDTAGNPGWYLCDPPGTPQKLGVEQVGVHDRPDLAAKTGQAPAKTGHDERPEMTAPARNGHDERPLVAAPTSIGSYNRNCSSDFPPTVQESAETSFRGAAGSMSTSGWMSDFDMKWRAQDFGGVIVANPTIGARRAHGLSEALFEHGGAVVADVLLHAAHEVARHLRGQGKGGLDPRVLSVAFRAERPSFGVLLDMWQRDTHRKRTSGKVSVPPAEIDGLPLDDEEQRLWMTSGGRASAILEHRKRKEQADFAADLLGVLS